jgi:hypothetical protein
VNTSMLAKKLADLAKRPASFRSAYEAGRDCGLHGANEQNCDFRWFSSAESLKEWERGKAAAREGRSA